MQPQAGPVFAGIGSQKGARRSKSEETDCNLPRRTAAPRIIPEPATFVDGLSSRAILLIVFSPRLRSGPERTNLNNTARSVINLFSTSLVMSFGHGMIIPTIPVMAVEFEVSIGLAAQVITAHALGRFASPLPTGIIVDRLGTRSAMIIGPGIVVLGAVLAAAAPTFNIMLLAMFLAGAGDSMWMSAREVAGVNLVHSNQRGRLMSGFMGISSTGMALGPALGGLITELVNFRAVFLVYTFLAVIVWVVAWVSAANTQAEVGRPSPSDHRARGLTLLFVWQHLVEWGRLLKSIVPEYRMTYAVLVFVTTVMMLYRMVLQSMLPLYAGAYLDYSPTQVGLLFSTSGIFVFAMIVPAGFITDKIGRKWATVPSTGIPGLAFLALPFVDSFPALLVISSVIGMGQGLSLGSVATSTYDVIPAAGRGRLQALRRTVAELGGVTGPAMGGLIANAYNPGGAFLVVGPLLMFASLLLAIVAKETLVKHREAEVAAEA